MAVPLARECVARIDAARSTGAGSACHALMVRRELAIAWIPPIMALQAIASRSSGRERAESGENQKCGENGYGTIHQRLLSEVLNQDGPTMHLYRATDIRE